MGGGKNSQRIGGTKKERRGRKKTKSLRVYKLFGERCWDKRHNKSHQVNNEIYKWGIKTKKIRDKRYEFRTFKRSFIWKWS